MASSKDVIKTLNRYVAAREALRTGQHTMAEKNVVSELEDLFAEQLDAAIEAKVRAMVGDAAILGSYRQRSKS